MVAVEGHCDYRVQRHWSLLRAWLDKNVSDHYAFGWNWLWLTRAPAVILGTLRWRWTIAIARLRRGLEAIINIPNSCNYDRGDSLADTRRCTSAVEGTLDSHSLVVGVVKPEAGTAGSLEDWILSVTINV